VEPVIQMDPTIQESTVTTSISKRGRKRKAVPTSETTPTGQDHRYSLKKSKPDYVQATTSSVSDDVDVITSDEEPTNPNNKKKQKYTERRRKNNIASQKSRRTRKKKFSALELQVEDLEIENQAMRAKIAMAEALTKELKDLLVSQLTGVKK
jgi:hypothetical protein